MKYILFLMIPLLAFTNYSETEYGALQGKLVDAESKEPILFGSLNLYQKNKHIKSVQTDLDGMYYFDKLEPGRYDLVASYTGYGTKKIEDIIIKADKNYNINIEIRESVLLEEVLITGLQIRREKVCMAQSASTISGGDISNLPTKSINAIQANVAGAASKNYNNVSVKGSRSNNTVYYVDGVRVTNANAIPQIGSDQMGLHYTEQQEQEYYGNESYTAIQENKFTSPVDEALSTFSIDVDRAGYSNVRRFLDNGQMPPRDAIRIEEMINYFDYNYDGPTNNAPFAIHNTLVDCPWNKNHQLMHIALQGKRIDHKELPKSNLVFLIDVSGSMNSANKLGLLKSSLKLMLENLRAEDRVAIVVYAGAAGQVLESTPASEKDKIVDALDQLRAGGSTAGGAGIQLAYKIAKQNFINDGNNRVILATDGDFNVGTSSEEGLEDLIEKERESGVFLSVLGYGMGNYQDSKMQILADKGNGNHAYIDNIQEARKVLVSEFAGTLFTIAKDVKIQIEFNPAYVQQYRLVGYENRMLAKEDFNNDKIDAGELGAGHTVTAIYEIIPTGVESSFSGKVDDLKYQANAQSKIGAKNGELATIKLRYKKPDDDKSKKIVTTQSSQLQSLDNADERVRFAAGVAYFGLSMSNSDYISEKDYQLAIDLTEKSKSYDPDGYRAECVRLVKAAAGLDQEYIANKE